MEVLTSRNLTYHSHIYSGLITTFLPGLQSIAGLNVSVRIILIAGAVGTVCCALIMMIYLGRKKLRFRPVQEPSGELRQMTDVELDEADLKDKISKYKSVDTKPRSKSKF